MAKTAAQTVAVALDKVREMKTRQGRQIPKLDAIEAVLHADLIDRRVGLTLPGEESPGLSLARRVRVAA